MANTLAYDWAHNLLPPAADPQTRVVAYLNDVNVESFIQVLAHNRQGDRITREDFEEHRKRVLIGRLVAGYRRETGRSIHEQVEG